MILPNITYDEKRRQMVQQQLEARGIVDEKVLKAMGKIPRHRFVPLELLDSAYADYPVPIDEGQTISQPYMVAYMVEALALKRDDKILEIGTGSGYQTAVLAEILENIYTVEIRLELAKKAMLLLNELGYSDRVHYHIADGNNGFRAEAPFKGIIVTAATYDIPKPLIDQLSDRGKIIIPIGSAEQQVLVRATKTGKRVKTEQLFGCIFVPLVRKDYGNN
ncbi:MAG: protein-L-isoaspartate(D-aspartate) O-methyltransferase [Planctomycetes bacterium]|nr:protein-L-isoaspartate(D-aspartate) O-methyltransferase [Planctomycetota bacterium]